MLQTTPFDTHTEEYEAWFDNYEFVYQSEILAISTQLEKLPENLIGIEIGLGTGRYATELGIKEGIEPSDNMRRIATERGIEVMDAVAENLPYKDLHFDFALFVTVCHLNDFERALKEAHRVIKHSGSVIIGFIDKSSTIGQQYEAKKNESTFYRQAHFYTPEEVKDLLRKTGFKTFDFVQTLYGELDSIDEVQMPREGYGEGSFVVARASK